MNNYRLLVIGDSHDRQIHVCQVPAGSETRGCSSHGRGWRPELPRGGILCSAGHEREPVTWTPTRAGRAKLSTLGCEQLFSTPGSKISPPGRDDQNVCRVCSLQTWICRHCAVDDMSGKAPPCVKARNAFFLERKLLLQNLKFLKIIPSENIIAFLTSKLTAECD